MFICSDQSEIILDESTVKELDGAYIFVATLLSNGTVFVGHSSFPRKYLSGLKKDFAGLNPIFIQIGFLKDSADDSGKTSYAYEWRRPRGELSSAILCRRFIYQWGFRFSIMVAKIVGRDDRPAYVVSTPRQQAESNAERTIFPWLENDARKIEPCPEIKAWAERCGLKTPAWAIGRSEEKRKQFLALMNNPKNEAHATVQDIVEIFFSFKNRSQIAPRLISEGMMAVHVRVSDEDDDKKYLIAEKIKRPISQNNSAVGGQTNNETVPNREVDETSGAFGWLKRDLAEISPRFNRAEFSSYLEHIITLAMVYEETGVKDDGGEVAMKLLAKAIPENDILIIFSYEYDCESFKRNVTAWFAS